MGDYNLGIDYGTTGGVFSAPSSPTFSSSPTLGGMSAGTASNVMAGGMFISALSSLGAGYAQAQGLKAQGNYQASVGKMNAELANFSATDALTRGTINANRRDQQVRGFLGTQKADFAAQGLDVSSGSAEDVMSSTRALGALDVINIKTNAYREAAGYQTQALQATASGQMAQISANQAANSSLLTGGMNAANFGLQGGYYLSGGGPLRNIGTGRAG